MPNPSAAIRLSNDGGTTYGVPGAGVTVDPSGAVTATLDSIDGVDTVVYEVISTDELTSPSNFPLTVSGAKGETVTWTAGAAGTAGILQATINGGRVGITGGQNIVDYTRTRTSVKWTVLTDGGLAVGCSGERGQGGSAGWLPLLNGVVRGVGTTANVSSLVVVVSTNKSLASVADSSLTVACSSLTVLVSQNKSLASVADSSLTVLASSLTVADSTEAVTRSSADSSLTVLASTNKSLASVADSSLTVLNSTEVSARTSAVTSIDTRLSTDETSGAKDGVPFSDTLTTSNATGVYFPTTVPVAAEGFVDIRFLITAIYHQDDDTIKGRQWRQIALAGRTHNGAVSVDGGRSAADAAGDLNDAVLTTADVGCDVIGTSVRFGVQGIAATSITWTLSGRYLASAY
jgi:hypothetical protein